MFISGALFYLLVLTVPQCLGEKYVDLTYSVDEESPTWPTTRPYTRDVMYKGYTDKGYWYESYDFCMSEHSGTHFDAPSHFAEGKWTTEQIPITHLIGRPGVVVDIQEKVEKDLLAELTANDLMAWLDENGQLPDGVVLFVRTGWGNRYGNKTAYFGTDTKDISKLKYPGINPGAAQLLTGYAAVTGRHVMGIGIDTPSLDNGASTEFRTHIELSLANIYGLENVANLEKLPTKGFNVTIMPMKIRGGSGAPVRIIASLPDKSTATQITIQVSHIYFMAAILALLSSCSWS